MSNTVKIAEKEFLDLLSNRLVTVILFVYAIIGLNDLYSHYENFNKAMTACTGANFLSFLLVFLTDFGSLAALAIGFFTIQSERRGHTLSTLIAKPVYRDTVINGKLLGATAFLLFVLTATTVLYSAGLLAFFGEQFVAAMATYVSGVPIVLLVSLVYVMIFFSIAMLLSICFRKDTFALFMSLLVWFFFLDVVPNVLFSGNAGLVFGGGFSMGGQQLGNSIAMLSPSSIRYDLVMGAGDLSGTIAGNLSEYGKLLLYVLIPLVLSYVVFVRRDVS